MFIFLILFFVVYVISFVFLIYKLNLHDDDIDTLYDNYSRYIEDSFKKGDKNNA